MATTGVIVGKFYPFHKGHAYMISEALEQCDELYVFACTRKEQYLAGEVRVDWIRKAFPVSEYPHLHVGIIDQDVENLPDRGPKEWAQVTRKKIGGRSPDMVFTSEDYGHNWANELGCEHILVDSARKQVPISGTQIRTHPLDNLQFLHPPARAYYCARIAFCGDDDALKQKVIQKLGDHYKALSVPDLFRTQSIQKPTTKKQIEIEDWAAQIAGPLLLCTVPAWDTPQANDAHLLERYAAYIVCGELTQSQQAHVLGGPHLLDPSDESALYSFVDTILTRVNGDSMPKLGVVDA